MGRPATTNSPATPAAPAGSKFSIGSFNWKKWAIWGGAALAVGVIGYVVIKKLR